MSGEPSSRDVLTRAILVEAVSLAGMALVIWYLGPGNVWLRHQVWRLRQLRDAPQAREDAEVARFRQDISRWEHEQAL